MSLVTIRYHCYKQVNVGLSVKLIQELLAIIFLISFCTHLYYKRTSTPMGRYLKQVKLPSDLNNSLLLKTR